MSAGFNASKMPKAILCYICGQGYGTKSINIHIKSCIKKWEQQQLLLDQKDRRAVPKPPKNWNSFFQDNQIMDNKVLKEINDEAYNNYTQEALIKCQFCQRSFNQSAYQKHQKICLQEKPLNPLNARVQQKNKKSMMKKLSQEKENLKEEKEDIKIEKSPTSIHCPNCQKSIDLQLLQVK